MRTAILAVGLTRTADTGQIDFATAVTPNAGNTAGGYDIFQFTDSLQSTAPLYIKLEYGCGGVAAAAGLWYTLGTGTDGAGTITGTTTARTQISMTTNTGSIFAYADAGGSLYLMMGDGSTAANNILLAFDRLRTLTNGITNLGSFSYNTTGGSAGAAKLLYFTGNQSKTTSTQTDIWPNLASALNPGATANDTTIVPPNLYVGVPLSAPLCIFKGADIAAYSQFTATVLGQSHTMLAGAPGIYGNSTTSRLAMPFDA